MVTRTNIVEAIRSLGVGPGDSLIAHCSYRSFGPRDDRVDGGPLAVAQALVDAVSPGGSAFVPAFTYGTVPFERVTTPSSDGAISECLRRLPVALRSSHPTHSLAGVGPEAAAILEGHDRVHPFAAGSPCWRLWERDAWVLLVGVGQEANSIAHVAEEQLKLPYLDRRRIARVAGANGEVDEVVVRRPGCSEAWGAALEAPLRAAGALHQTRIGASRFTLMRARAVVDTTANLLRQDPSALLCSACDCDACNTARQMLRAAGA